MLSSRENLLPYSSRPLTVDRRWKPNVELAPNCPRCDSSNTKFCYYNNYSLSQPRYFCKGCRRYWTKGGSLRNVPVGGGCRKNRRGKPLRLPSDPSSAGRELPSCSRPIPGSVRPDLALDGMVGNSTSCRPTAADGSTIDLAMLYAKFLNPCAELDGDGVAPRYAGGIDEPLEAFGDHQIPVSLPDNDGFMECNGEVNFSMDSSFGYESLAYPIESNINNLFSSNCSLGVPTLTTWDATKNSEQSFESIPEDSMALHQNIIASDWSALDCSALEAFYRS